MFSPLLSDRALVGKIIRVHNRDSDFIQPDEDDFPDFPDSHSPEVSAPSIPTEERTQPYNFLDKVSHFNDLMEDFYELYG